MTKDKIFPNFWQAFLIIACWATTNLIIWTLTTVMIYDHDDSVFYQTLQVILMELNYIPYIVILARKTNIRIWDYFSIPDSLTLFKIIVVSLLLRFVISISVDQPVEFIKSLIESKIRLHGIDFNNKKPEIVIALRWIFIPVIEEILYRGLILRGFLNRYSPIKAILLSSVIFSFAHLNIERGVFLFASGVILGLFYYKTNSILVSSISHFIFNMVLILRFKYIDLNPTSLIVYSIVFIASILIIIFILQKPMKTEKFNSLISNLKI
jgi:membrane protease YdiL (CAAX protease family)